MDEPTKLETWMLEKILSINPEVEPIPWVRAVWVYTTLANYFNFKAHEKHGLNLLSILDRAITFAETHKLHYELIEMQLRRNLFTKKKIEKADFELALQQVHKHGLLNQRLYLLVEYAFLSIISGELERGSAMLNEVMQAMHQTDQLTHYEELTLNYYVALGFRHLGQIDSAINLFKSLNVQAAEMQVKDVQLGILSNLISLLLESARQDSDSLKLAQDYVDEKLELDKKLERPWETAMSLLSQAKIAKARMKLTESENFARQALQLFEAEHDNINISKCLHLMAQIEFTKNNWLSAKKLGESALENITPNEQTSNAAEIYQLLYEVAKKTHDQERVIRYLELYMQSFKRVTQDKEKDNLARNIVGMRLKFQEERNRLQQAQIDNQMKVTRYQTMVLILLALCVLIMIFAAWKLKRNNEAIAALNRFIRTNVLERFLPPELVNEILQQRSRFDEAPQQADVTVFFADLCCFTAATEQLGVEKISAILNEFLETMTDTIFRHGGTIDKFIGDGIMVMFGAPTSLPLDKQAAKAVACCVEMMASLQHLNRHWEINYGWKFQMRIGINQGTAIVGSFGSSKRGDYTVVGGTVNIASRVENAASPDQIFLTESVARHLTDVQMQCEGIRQLRGIKDPVMLYSLKTSIADLPTIKNVS